MKYFIIILGIFLFNFLFGLDKWRKCTQMSQKHSIFFKNKNRALQIS